ncbi:extracellular solute-binding protein [Paenibacillus filicis]|uniref:Extracellular solute-binding protein n=1 Tax=Paenibacillus gyeongsangnamensis TaxID=3388067 RepID=A0ABT4Q489_9BACL|nr:extracellular solute-binding protein [Paenibacillus filicis]MCZ8511649.1 extracellular solute-binding protein [Paenibacillus filicis]
MKFHSKEQRWKRSSLSLAAVMMASALAGCASTGNSSNPTGSAASPSQTATGNQTAASSAPYKFSYMTPVWVAATYTKGGPFEKELFKAANVDIDVQVLPVADYNQKVNVVLASGSIPDVLWGSGPTDKVWKDAQDQGAFLKINKYLDQYPAIKNAIPAALWDKLKDKNGDIYFIPNANFPITPFSLYYRKDWFDKLGIAEPKTIDELVADLEKIKNSDLGKQGIIPLSIGNMNYAKDLATSFGLSLAGWEPSSSDPNKLIPWYANPKDIDFYFWMQDLMKKGLLDPAFKVDGDATQTKAKFIAGKAAVVTGNWSTFTDYVTKTQQNDKNAKVGVISPLTGPGGIPGGVRTQSGLYDRGFYVSAKIKNPDAFFKFLNWTLTDGYNLTQYGIEGKTYVMKDGQPASIPDGQRDPAYQRPQIDPLSFITPIDLKSSWAPMKASMDADTFAYVKQKFDDYLKVKYSDYRDPFVDAPLQSKNETQMFNDYMLGVTQGAVLNPQITKQNWMDALQKWEKAGGSAMIDEVNRLQTNKSNPDFSMYVKK